MSSTQPVNRLRTFETSEDEELVILAGKSQHESREIFRGSTAGRYAIVPVDELDYERPHYGDDLDIGDLEVLGQSATIEPEDQSVMTLLKDDELVVRGGDPGVYGLLRIPFEQEKVD